jgi:peptidyl-prolyl cis-trans isomerase A (cyclophilin A)
MPVLVLLAAVAAVWGQTVPIRIETDLGTIEAEIDVRHAPITAKNFLRYVDAGRYNGGQFHRTVKLDNQPEDTTKIEVIQASRVPRRKRFERIPLERTTVTGLSHVNGALSMARDEPDTATSDFFVCIGTNHRSISAASGIRTGKALPRSAASPEECVSFA